MTSVSWPLWLLLVLPLAAAGLAPLGRTPRRALGGAVLGTLLTAGPGFGIAVAVLAGAPVTAAHGWLYLDALGAWHLAVMLLVYVASALYSWSYFGAELAAGHLTLRQARLFAGLWCASLAAMTLVLISNNLGMMWVGIEATTLVTAFLICLHETKPSLEAMWKYILICSVGVAFAFMGVLLVAAAAGGLGLPPGDVMLWTTLRAHAAELHPLLMQAAFIFMLVGYGTKAGLAPMHNWLPDAHSQAPAPVSALFSGFMLNAALYCLLRQVPLVEAATGNAGWGRGLLAGFGLLSIVVAAAFIVFQHDLKRLLAYHSVEHLGIIALGVGLGGFGAFAALFHTLNHSLCKMLAFFAAGRLGQKLGTHDLREMTGTLRLSRAWGLALFGSFLALIGVAPFALFMSELQLLAAAVAARAWLTIAIFLAGSGVVFVGALAHAIPLAWGERSGRGEPERDRGLDTVLALAPLLLLIVLGLWLPGPLAAALQAAAAVVNGR